jgi:hypothetical protein
MHVLGDENPVENKSIRDQFVGAPADYEVSRSRLVRELLFNSCNLFYFI